jgi:hypothetical protein
VGRLNHVWGNTERQATKLRFLAYQTEYPGGRHQLLMLANSFDKLADRVEARGTALTTAAD